MLQVRLRASGVRTAVLLSVFLAQGSMGHAAAQEVTPPGHKPDSRVVGMAPPGEGPLVGSIPAFPLPASSVTLERLAQPDTYLDKAGRRFALLGTESGQFEAWAWPLKLFRDFRLSFLLGESTTPIESRDIVQRVEAGPAVSTITYVYQSFTVQAHVVTAIDAPGAVILLDVDSHEPLSVVVSFLPTMQPMWPAGLGGQYARWQENLNAYLISESSNGNHAYLGSPAGHGLSYTPAHMLGEAPNQFRIDIPDPSSVRDRFVPIVMAGGKGRRDDVRAAYEQITADPQSLVQTAAAHFDQLLESTLSITTPEPDLDMALEWAKVSYDNLLARNPDFTGTGLMAGLDRAGAGGRPGFGWFFGGDTYLNTLSLNAIGMFDASREAILFMAQFQREDGKMAHEVTQAWKYVDWFGDYPYAYIHADTTPWFIVAVHDYVMATGDRDVLRTLWPRIQKAYAWCLTTDVDGDGLMDNEAAGLGALEFGALTGIRTDVYLGAIWTRALMHLSVLAEDMGDVALAREASSRYASAAGAFEQFWSTETRHYAYAFDGNGHVVDEVTPWSSVGVIFGLGSPARRTLTMERISHSDVTTDWGARMLSTRSDLFEPLNYNYGAVWPFITSWVTTAQYATSRPLQGYSSLMSTVQHVTNRSMGHVTEVMSGARHTWPQESVPHQGFATASTVLPTVRGLLGLNYNAATGILTFAPQVPADWDHYELDHFRFGPSTLAVRQNRKKGSETFLLTTGGASGTTILFSPLYPPGTRVYSVRSGTTEIDFETRDEPGGVRVLASLPLADSLRMVVQHSDEPTVVAPVWQSPIGSESRGIRVITFERVGEEAVLEVEGVPGQSYFLGLHRADRVRSARQANLVEGGLRIDLPESRADHVSLRIHLEIGH